LKHCILRKQQDKAKGLMAVDAAGGTTVLHSDSHSLLSLQLAYGLAS